MGGAVYLQIRVTFSDACRSQRRRDSRDRRDDDGVYIRTDAGAVLAFKGDGALYSKPSFLDQFRREVSW
jgi:hypothetical protein